MGVSNYDRDMRRQGGRGLSEQPKLAAVVLAAGEGTRMRSSRPKPLHRLCGRPMVLWVLGALSGLDVSRVVVVVGPRFHPDDEGPGRSQVSGAAARGGRTACAARHRGCAIRGPDRVQR